MKQDKKSLAVAVVASLSAGVAGAAENPFALKDLASGYAQVAEAEQAKAKPEGKCGAAVMKSNPEMKCGAEMMKMPAPAPDKKAVEGKCAGMKMDGATPPKTDPAPAAPK
jgi:uncharacterized low-complexity protein